MRIHDRQLVMALPVGRAPAEDAVVAAAAEGLHDKWARLGCPSAVVAVPPSASALDGALAGLGAASRLVLVGTSEADGARIGGRGPEALAALLAASGLRAVGRISLVADRAAAPVEAPGDVSFAARFHAALRQAHGIATELTARIGEVAVVLAGVDRGRKQTRDAEGRAWGAKRPRSKVLYGWSGDTQTRRWPEEA